MSTFVPHMVGFKHMVSLFWVFESLSEWDVVVAWSSWHGSKYSEVISGLWSKVYGPSASGVIVLRFRFDNHDRGRLRARSKLGWLMSIRRSDQKIMLSLGNWIFNLHLSKDGCNWSGSIAYGTVDYVRIQKIGTLRNFKSLKNSWSVTARDRRTILIVSRDTF